MSQLSPTPSPPLAPLEERKGGGFVSDASSNDRRRILVQLEDTFTKERSIDEPFVVEFSEVTPELSDPIHAKFLLDLAPSFPFYPFLPPSKSFTLL